MNKKDDPEYVPKRTSFGSGPHQQRELDVKKGHIRKKKHKKPTEESE